MKNNSYYNLEVDTVVEKLDSSLQGISDQEAEKRLELYGLNALPQKEEESLFILFIKQFENPLIYILFAAAFISILTDHVVDGLIVVLVILVSATVGFVQEFKANRALESLNKLIKYKARVIRSGETKVIELDQVVPGDLIYLATGYKVPADARIIEAQDFEVTEAALTGESVPSTKIVEVLPEETPLADRENMVYLGTVVAKGWAKAVVVETGSNTELGIVASLVEETEESSTPLQTQLLSFTKIVGIMLVVLTVFIFGFGILTGRPLFEMFLTSVAIIVSAVPEGLLPAMTIVLAIGAQKLAQKNGLVRKMIAAETLGSVTVACSDKTGTLTQGNMAISQVATLEGEAIHTTSLGEGDALSELEEKMLVYGYHCNAAILRDIEDGEQVIEGNPTDKAFKKISDAIAFEQYPLEQISEKIDEIPFSSDYKYMATLHSYDENHNLVLVKGAPEKVLKLSEKIVSQNTEDIFSEDQRQSASEEYNHFMSKGLRVIAVAQLLVDKSTTDITQKDIANLTFLGMVMINDPLRPEAKEAVKVCKRAGVRPIMITGDHRITASSIGEELGLDVGADSLVEGSQISELSDEELKEVVKKATIFARVEPKHKIRIVEALQANGEVVAMIGDGVNDSPALKKADVGVSVGSGTDVAKEVADLVLLDDNFNTLVEAIKRGRIIFNNIRKVILYLITDAFSEMILIGGAVLLGMPLPVLPVQILWIKLLESAAPSAALAFDEVDEKVMNLPPRSKNEPLLNGSLKKMIGFYSVIMDLTLFSIFLYYFNTSGDITYARTITFVGLGFASLFYIFSVRGMYLPIYKINPFSNKFLLGSVLVGFLLFVVALYVPFFNEILETVPLGVSEWIVLTLYACLSIVVYEIGKFLFIKRGAPVSSKSGKKG